MSRNEKGITKAEQQAAKEGEDFTVPSATLG